MNKQNIKLTMMFILGLPGLPFACLMWLLDNYIVAHNLPPEKRAMHTKEDFIAFMCACTFMGGLIYAIVRATG